MIKFIKLSDGYISVEMIEMVHFEGDKVTVVLKNGVETEFNNANDKEALIKALDKLSELG